MKFLFIKSKSNPEKFAKGKFYWKMIGRNGKILAHSEQYNTKQSIMKTANLIQRTFGEKAKYQFSF